MATTWSTAGSNIMSLALKCRDSIVSAGVLLLLDALKWRHWNGAMVLFDSSALDGEDLLGLRMGDSMLIDEVLWDAWFNVDRWRFVRWVSLFFVHRGLSSMHAQVTCAFEMEELARYGHGTLEEISSFRNETSNRCGDAWNNPSGFCSLCMILSSQCKSRLCGDVMNGALVLSHKASGGSSWARPMSRVGATISPPCLRQQDTLHAAFALVVKSGFQKICVFQCEN